MVLTALSEKKALIALTPLIFCARMWWVGAPDDARTRRWFLWAKLATVKP